MDVFELYQILLDYCPVDTGNMKTNIYIYDKGEYWEIKVETNYASYTNYNRQRGAKEKANYLWVERAIQDWAMRSEGEVNNELS